MKLAVLQDIRVYEQIQESLALLKILSLSKKNMEKGRFKPVKRAFEDLRKRIQGNSFQTLSDYLSDHQIKCLYSLYP